MSTVYVIAQDRNERDACIALFSEAGAQVRRFADAEAFLSQKEFDLPGCVVLALSQADELSLLQAAPESLPIIVISSNGAVPFAVRVMKAGAFDFIRKPGDLGRLLGSASLAMEASRAGIERARQRQESTARFRRLSARERDVVDAVIGGSGNREVALQLGIKARTVEIHRSNAMAKLGARTLPDLVRIWLDADEVTSQFHAR